MSNYLRILINLFLLQKFPKYIFDMNVTYMLVCPSLIITSIKRSYILLYLYVPV